MSVRRLLAIPLAVCLVALGVAGCGEKPQVVNYKQGKYQGKPDSPSWENERFKGDQTAWEKQLRQRNLAQNEYLRTN
ncbi:MAG: hypothetical protein ACR2FI_13485 [Burkholderiales bacterium]|nr:hypothetical protein [Burkholderiales bacterium]